MARPDKLPKVLTETKTEALLSRLNQCHFGPHRDHSLHALDGESRNYRLRYVPLNQYRQDGIAPFDA